MEEKISLADLFKIFQKRSKIIIGTTLVGLLAAAVYTFILAVPQYSSTTQLLVNQQLESSELESADIDRNVQLISTYSELIKTPVILNAVINELELNSSVESLRKQIDITTENDSQLFSIHVTDDSPSGASEIANAIPDIFKENVDTMMNLDNIMVVSEAPVNTEPVSPIKMLNLTIGLMIGLIIGASMTLISEFLDTTIKDEKFVVNELGWTNLGSIPEMSLDELKRKEESKVPQMMDKVSVESPLLKGAKR